MVNHLMRRIERISVHYDEASLDRPHQHHGKLQQVGKLDRDSVTRLEPGFMLQVCCKAGSKLVDFILLECLAETIISISIAMFASDIVIDVGE